MKKLMVVLAAVAMAVSAKAATANWQYWDATGNWEAGDWAGYEAYVVLGNTAQEFDSLGALQDASVSHGTIKGNASVGFFASGSASDAAIVKGTSFDYMVYIVNGDKYAVDGKFTFLGSEIYDPNTDSPIAPESVPDNGNLLTAGVTWNEFGSAAPEPTSGLLLLIGVAGLALRRRRA